MAARELATSEGSWLGSLGASLVLHGGAVAVLLGAALQAPQALQDAPDLWQGGAVVVDTWHDAPGAAPVAAPVEPTQPAPPPAVAAARPPGPLVEHNETVKQSVTLKHSATHAVKPSLQPPAKAPPVDPNAALLAKVMGYRPHANNDAQPNEGGALAQANERGQGSLGAGVAREGAVRNLPKAFTRALAYAAQADTARWAALPRGGKGDEAKLTIDVGEGGEILRHTPERGASSRMRELFRRTLLLMGSGQFALRSLQVSPGSLAFEVEVSTRDDSGVANIAYEAPQPGREGKATFTSGAGFRFDAKVRELR